MENPSAAVRKAHRKRRIIEEVKGWGWLAPSLIGVLIFFIIPFCVVIYYSVLDNPIFSNFVGLDNYIKLFSNAAFLRAAKNTAIFSGIAVPLSVVLSLWM
ncbi:MAG: sugar ABC transporter permease, partial [Oscillospiraceae bacterium]|nr:sugar ABC transporter permease [Oscillospiraceae bacterium]